MHLRIKSVSVDEDLSTEGLLRGTPAANRSNPPDLRFACPEGRD